MSTGSLLTNWLGSGSVSFGTGGICQRGEVFKIISQILLLIVRFIDSWRNEESFDRYLNVLE